ncbi:hypothetical protein ACP4OV_015899 [Aristida adscensionis]
MASTAVPPGRPAAMSMLEVALPRRPPSSSALDRPSRTLGWPPRHPSSPRSLAGRGRGREGARWYARDERRRTRRRAAVVHGGEPQRAGWDAAAR